MDSKTTTGQAIYEKHRIVMSEIKELTDAYEILYDEQNGSIAYTLVKEALESKRKDLTNLQNKVYHY